MQVLRILQINIGYKVNKNPFVLAWCTGDPAKCQATIPGDWHHDKSDECAAMGETLTSHRGSKLWAQDEQNPSQQVPISML
jgi:hypothetical protein